MDEDEALARRLQEEEDNAALEATARAFSALRPHDIAAAETEFVSQIEGAVKKVLSYEDELAQAIALSVMDMAEMQEKAADAASLSCELDEAPPLASEDALAMELLTWFKQTFRWVDAPACETCGQSDTRFIGPAAPTDEEAACLASRTEVYVCTSCRSTTRFPRYNDPVKLMETQRGRCGEFANAFCHCCRAAGLESRLVLDWTDHLWVEYYSKQHARWIHLDPCEAIADRPLLYEAGWGKKLNYVIAVGRFGAHDVTQRYTKTWQDVKTRRHLREGWVQRYLAEVTSRLRAAVDARLLENLERMDATDEMSIKKAAASLSNVEALPGRTTGSSAWVASRGEDGGGAGCRRGGRSRLQASDVDVQTKGTMDDENDGIGDNEEEEEEEEAKTNASCTQATRYRRVVEILNEKHEDGGDGLKRGSETPRRVIESVGGGVCRASGENPPTETCDKAFDGRLDTKWLDFSGKAANTAWLEYRLLPSAAPLALRRCALTSANDAAERDPKHIAIDAWDEERNRWVVIAKATNLRFPHRGHTCEVEIQNDGPGSNHTETEMASRRWRLRVLEVADMSRANSVQLAKWELFAQLHETAMKPPSDTSNEWAALFQPAQS